VPEKLTIQQEFGTSNGVTRPPAPLPQARPPRRWTDESGSRHSGRGSSRTLDHRDDPSKVRGATAPGPSPFGGPSFLSHLSELRLSEEDAAPGAISWRLLLRSGRR
jgi:hypothetical protein